MLTAVVSLLPESILHESESIRTEYFEYSPAAWVVTGQNMQQTNNDNTSIIIEKFLNDFIEI